MAVVPVPPLNASMSDVYFSTTLLIDSTGLRHIHYALQVFDKLPNCHVAVWKAITTGYTDNRPKDVAFYLFKDMHRMDIQPDNYTFAGMLSLCSLDLELLNYKRLIKSGFLVGTSMVNSLITVF